jgi:phage gp16-like protein
MDRAQPKASPDPRRNAMLAAVHAKKRQLGQSDEDYRATNRAITGKESAAEMNIDQLGLVLDNYRKKGVPSSRTRRPNERPGQPQQNMAWGIWKDLARLGAIDEPSEKGLQNFVRKTTGIARLEWLHVTSANKVIEGLKGWRRREQQKAGVI